VTWLVEVDPSIGLRFVELGDDSKKLWGAGWTGLAARDQTFALEADRARADRCLSRSWARRPSLTLRTECFSRRNRCGARSRSRRACPRFAAMSAVISGRCRGRNQEAYATGRCSV